MTTATTLQEPAMNQQPARRRRSRPIPVAEQMAPAPAMGQELSQGLCLAHVLVKSPSYRIKMVKSEVTAATENGEARQVAKDKMTGNRWVWNRHRLFDQMLENGRKVTLLLDRYSVSEGKPSAEEDEGNRRGGGGGYRIMPMDAVARFHVGLLELIAERNAIIDRMKENWWTEVLPGISEFFGEHFYQIRPSLPSGPEDLEWRFRVRALYWPLTPLNPSKLSMAGLTADQQQKFILSQEEELKGMFKDRFAAMFDTIFLSVYDVCQDILHGEKDPQTGLRSGQSPIESGRRKEGALEPILAVLDRVKNFSQFASPEVLEAVDNARGLIGAVTHRDLNLNGGKNLTTTAIKAALEPLGNAVKRLWEAKRGQAVRKIAV